MLCKICGKNPVPRIIPVCVNCLRERFEEAEKIVLKAHETREKFGLPSNVPGKGVQCFGCGNECRIPDGEKGFCGLIVNEKGKLKKLVKEGYAIGTCYYDLLPTNCVAAWACAERSPKADTYNLAVFLGACNYDCLFCQNWEYRKMTKNILPQISCQELAGKINEKTACVCFFGGDPGPQMSYVIKASEAILKKKKETHICLESNGNLNKKMLEKFAEMSFNSKGTIKFDLKFFNEKINKALCGVSNKKTYENFEFLAKNFKGILHASSLLIPGYFDEKELKSIVNFISSLDKSVPYSLLGFWPAYEMTDWTYLSIKKALEFKEIAEKKLEKVRIGNLHLLS